MAKYYSKKTKKSNKKRRKYSELERFAFILGCVNRGLDKGGNKVTDAYNRGNAERKPRSKKPII
ncbi:MAG: hypothetical protein IJW93_02810 [Clostridia bacterium]|nr:hypothetical protein [Clostridia bacterium]